MRDNADRMGLSGYIYAATNDAMPGLVKIGGTARPPRERVKELGGPTGVPTPYTLVHYEAVDNWRLAEAKLHALFAEERISNDREFFRVTPLRVIAAMKALGSAVGHEEMYPATRVEIAGVVRNSRVEIDGDTWYLQTEPEEPSDRVIFRDNSEYQFRQTIAAARASVAAWGAAQAALQEAKKARRKFWFQSSKNAAAQAATLARVDAVRKDITTKAEALFALEKTIAADPTSLWSFLEGYWYFRSRLYRVFAPHLTQREKAQAVRSYAERHLLYKERQRPHPMTAIDLRYKHRVYFIGFDEMRQPCWYLGTLDGDLKSITGPFIIKQDAAHYYSLVQTKRVANVGFTYSSESQPYLALSIGRQDHNNKCEMLHDNSRIDVGTIKVIFRDLRPSTDM